MEVMTYIGSSSVRQCCFQKDHPQSKEDVFQIHQKCAEVVGALQMFRDGVQGMLNQITMHCQTLVLERLGHRITNYLSIINRLHIQVIHMNVST